MNEWGTKKHCFANNDQKVLPSSGCAVGLSHTGTSEPDILFIQFDVDSAHRVIVCNFPFYFNFYILNSFVITRFLETEIDFTWVYPPEVPKSAAIIILACFLLEITYNM